MLTLNLTIDMVGATATPSTKMIILNDGVEAVSRLRFDLIGSVV
jgi:hypothetical protein